jgi:hypothetical protein
MEKNASEEKVAARGKQGKRYGMTSSCTTEIRAHVAELAGRRR